MLRRLFRQSRPRPIAESSPEYAATPTAQTTARTLLRKALNNPKADFRTDQWETIESLVYRQQRVLLVQRTGWGKSIVYFIATALMREQGSGPTILISPLLSLMRNQISAARRIGIRAATINSSNTKDWSEISRRIHADEVDILLISPERLSNRQFREQILQSIASRIGLLVVDEAHCISDWGHDFRPDYRRIVRVLQIMPRNVPVLATTATANDRVIKDITMQLGESLTVVRGPLDRSSLQLQTLELPNPAHRLAWLTRHLPDLPGSGIIYTLTVADADSVAGWLRLNGIAARAYSAWLDHHTREDLENRLLDNRLKVLVATVALGMGFDKPDLGFVIHYQRPGSVVAYYQQIGRAGRAIDNAYAILMHGWEDDEIIDYFIKSAFPPEVNAEAVIATLNQAEHGLTIKQLEPHANLPQWKIRKLLKVLSLESPAPVQQIGSRWYTTPVRYRPDRKRIEQLTALRHDEQQQMNAYMSGERCLMEFLLTELNDPVSEPCGRCAVCLDQPVIRGSFSEADAKRAIQYLRSAHIQIKPRKIWPGSDGPSNMRGRIARNLQYQTGRSLCRWGDAGWGDLVRRGKLITGQFDRSLEQATVEMIRSRWKPNPEPLWATCVPSLRHPNLVPDFARTIANELQIPFIPCIQKIRETSPQKEMQNSFQQMMNIGSVFEVRSNQVRRGPVLLIDDMVDSRWTFTVLATLLRKAGSGPVYPVALASVWTG